MCSVGWVLSRFCNHAKSKNIRCIYFFWNCVQIFSIKVVGCSGCIDEFWGVPRAMFDVDNSHNKFLPLIYQSTRLKTKALVDANDFSPRTYLLSTRSPVFQPAYELYFLFFVASGVKKKKKTNEPNFRVRSQTAFVSIRVPNSRHVDGRLFLRFPVYFIVVARVQSNRRPLFDVNE